MADLEISDADLKSFANVEIAAFLETFGDTSVQTVRQFAGEGGKSLLPGSGALGADALLKKQFGTMCTTLDGLLTTFQKQMTKAQADLRAVDSIFQEAHDDALTAAEMMQILQGLMTEK
ncbi:hypothetical protein ACWGB8_06575 [Kitasatospora sp. NPDC054939]